MTEAVGKSVEELWQEFKHCILDLRNRFVPLKVAGKPFWKSKGTIPLGKELRDHIREKRRLHRKWLRSSPRNSQENRSNYVRTRNKVNSMIIQAKRNYQRDICKKSKDNPKVFWSHVRSTLKAAGGVSPLIENIGDETLLKHDDRDKANLLQKQFCSVFTREPDGELPHFEPRTDKIMEDKEISVEKVYQQLKELDPNKSFGPDEIHPKMLKELAAQVSEPLATIMNKSISEGCLPTDWKKAHVTPIYKNKGARNLPINYRPVSLTSIACKAMESILRIHIMNHLENENLLSNKQYGFINKRSTVTQLLNFLDKCCKSLAKGQVVDTIYFDFAKAFDTVPHQRLIKKLEGYGIKGATLSWIRSFLTNRKQLVKVNGENSTLDDVISGIPQGSVLGPLLFVIFINDLPEQIDSNILLFADDTKIFKEITKIDDSIMMQNDIYALEKWSNDWLLKFHPDKCHVLTIGKHSNIQHAHRYVLNDIELEHVFIEKDLGILIDSELTFQEHISKQVNKANSMLSLVRRSFTNLTASTFLLLYTSFVRPHLEYAQSVWCPKLRKFVNQLENVQRRATKLVDMYKHLSYSDRLKRLELPSLEFRRTFCDMVQVYKHIHIYHQDTTPNKLLRKVRPSRKHQYELIPNFANDGFLGPQTKSFYYRCVPTWNNLPREVVEAPTIKAFKAALSKAWSNHPLRYSSNL